MKKCAYSIFNKDNDDDDEHVDEDDDVDSNAEAHQTAEEILNEILQEEDPDELEPWVEWIKRTTRAAEHRMSAEFVHQLQQPGRKKGRHRGAVHPPQHGFQLRPRR